MLLLQRCAESRALSGTRRPGHIQPLRHLHWLSFSKRVYFKLTTLIYQAMHGLLPSYLSDPLFTNPDRSRLCSSTTSTCFVPCSYSSSGDNSFCVAGPMEQSTSITVVGFFYFQSTVERLLNVNPRHDVFE